MCSQIDTLNELCRACLNKRQNMKQLLNSNDETHKVISKFASLLHSEIQINNQLPCFLCCECEEKLDESFEFQQLCQQSLEYMNTLISNGVDDSRVARANDTLNVEEQIHDDNFGDSTDGEIADHVENSLDLKEATREVTKSSNKQVMKLSQYPQEEVNSVIRNIKEKLAEHQNCLYCNYTAKGSRYLSFHMNRLHQEHKGTWCSKCNENVANLSQHWKDEHEHELKCHFCGKKVDKISRLIEHLSCHTVDRKYSCDICKKCFISTSHLRAHSKVHSTKKKYSCLVCLETVRTKQSLMKHLRSHKMHKCKVCEDNFDQKNYESHSCFVKTEMDVNGNDTDDNAEIRIQTATISSKCKKENGLDEPSESMQNRHVEDMKALCIYCGKKFRTPSKLSVHMRVHTGETPYQCSYCNIKMTTRSHLVVHERTHTGEKPYVCDTCGKGFAQSSVLSTHKKIHTGRTEQCLLCPKKFCRPSELKQHMRKHTGEKPFLCECCNKSFIQRSHLVEHLWTHTDEIRFKCEFCEKGFKYASSLKSHLNVHLERKPNQCSKCPYSSQRSQSMQQHLLQHHQPKEEISYRCEICDLTFLSMAAFSSHCSTEHEVITFSNEEKFDFVQEKDKYQAEVQLL